MKAKIGMMVVVLAFLVASTLNLHFATTSAAQKEQPAAKTKWEYKRIVGTPTEEELNKLGGEGWDLIHVEPQTPYTKSTQGPFNNNPPITQHNILFVPEVLYFKRAK